MKTFSTYIVFCILFFCSNELLSQTGDNNINRINLSTENLRYGKGVREIKAPVKYKGSSLLFHKYSRGILVLKNGGARKIAKINFDLVENTIRIMDNDVTYELPLNYVDSLLVYNNEYDFHRQFIQVNDGDQFVFLEVMVDGKYPLLKKLKTKIRKPTYNPLLDIGEKMHKITKKEVYYTLINSKLLEIHKTPKTLNKDKNFPEIIRKAVSEKGVNFKKEKGVINFFIEINQEEN
ncbi:MAG: hypothetical protein V3V14_00730 [Saprospiraceae bacterium]